MTYVALTAAVLLVTFGAVYQAISFNVRNQIESQFEHANKAFKRHIADQAERLTTSASALVSDFAFREVIATGDAGTGLSAIRNLATRLKADRVMIMTLDGEVVADTRKPDLDPYAFPFPSMIDIADENDHAEAMLVLDNRLYEMVIVPVLAPIPIAWVAVGVQVDDAMAEMLKVLSPITIDISFIQSNSSSGAQILASTFNPALQAGLLEIFVKPGGFDTREDNRALITEIPVLPKAPMKVNGSGVEFFTLVSPIVTAEGVESVVAVLQYPIDAAFQSYQPLVYWLVGLSIAGLLIMVVGSVSVGRSVTRPVRILADAAKRIAAGDYQEKIQLKQADELGQLASAFNLMMGGISEREDKIRYQAHHDLQTGLPNRRKLMHEMDVMIEGDGLNQAFSLILVGIGRLREINNTLGHDVGDALMRQVGERLQAVVPESLVTRVASQTLVIMIKHSAQAVVEPVIDRLSTVFSQPFSSDNINIDVQVHIGVCSYPQHAVTSKRLIQCADVAMNAARRGGRLLAIYDVENDTYNKKRLSMMGDLKLGLARDELQLFYQPNIDLESGRVTHVEALVRWNHPQHGFMLPDEFIPLAEQTGQIYDLSLWVLDTAIKQCAIWIEAGFGLRVAVNLSAKDLLKADLPNVIQGLLKRYRVTADHLVLEITESALMQDPEAALSVLKQLSSMGITLSIDDFGTGYSSMAYLKVLPVNILKIDKSFVLGLASSREDETLVHAMIELGHHMGLNVFAEGVEDQASLDSLKRYHCDIAQGFFFSIPLPASEFNDWLYTSPWGIGQTYPRTVKFDTTNRQ